MAAPPQAPPPPAGDVAMLDATGNPKWVPAELVAEKQGFGWRVESAEQERDRLNRKELTVGNVALGSAERLASGATLGGTDFLGRMISDEYSDAAARRKEALGGVGQGLELVGTVLPALLSGGAGAAGTGARLSGRTLLGSAARALPASANTRGAAIVGEKIAEIVPQALKSTAKLAAQGAVEGAGYGAGQQLSEASLTNDFEDLGQKLWVSGVEGATTGFVAGGGLGALAAVGRAGIKAVTGGKSAKELLSGLNSQKTLGAFRPTPAQLRKLTPERQQRLERVLNELDAPNTAGRTPDEQLTYAAGLKKEYGAVIGDVVSKLDQHNPASLIDNAEEVRASLAGAANRTRSSAAPKTVDALDALAQKPDLLFDDIYKAADELRAAGDEATAAAITAQSGAQKFVQSAKLNPVLNRFNEEITSLAASKALPDRKIARALSKHLEPLYEGLQFSKAGDVVSSKVKYSDLKRLEETFAELGEDAYNSALKSSERRQARSFQKLGNELRDFITGQVAPELGDDVAAKYIQAKERSEAGFFIEKAAKARRGKPEQSIRQALSQQYGSTAGQAIAAAGSVAGQAIFGSAAGALGVGLVAPLAARLARPSFERGAGRLLELANRGANIEARITKAVEKAFAVAGRGATGVALEASEANKKRKGRSPQPTTDEILQRQVGETRAAAYERVRKNVQEAIAIDPAPRYADIAAVAPETAKHMIATEQRALNFLADKLGVSRELSNPVMARVSNEPPPTPDQIRRHALYLMTTQNPSAAIDALEDGTLRHEQVEVLKEVAPKLYEKMRGGAIAHLLTLKHDLPYQRRVKLSLLLELPLDPGLRPAAVAATQSIYLPVNQKEPEGGGSQNVKQINEFLDSTNKLNSIAENLETDSDTI